MDHIENMHCLQAHSVCLLLLAVQIRELKMFEDDVNELLKHKSIKSIASNKFIATKH